MEHAVDLQMRTDEYVTVYGTVGDAQIAIGDRRLRDHIMNQPEPVSTTRSTTILILALVSFRNTVFAALFLGHAHAIRRIEQRGASHP